MDVTQLSPDEVVYWEWGFFEVNATILFTWAVMTLMIGGVWFFTRHLTSSSDLPRGQNVLEVVIDYISGQIREISGGDRPEPYLPFIGTLFLFIATANLLTILPGYVAPTASLSTTAALAIVVFLAVPVFGVTRQGWRAYLRHYIEQDDASLYVITHGTDTMAETADALQGLEGKAIVLTGALTPARFRATDAIFNVGMAVAAVQVSAPGVYIAMSGQVFAAGEVRKNRAENRFEAL